MLQNIYKVYAIQITILKKEINNIRVYIIISRAYGFQITTILNRNNTNAHYTNIMNRNNYNYFWKTLNPKQGLPTGPHWSVRGPAQP